MIVGTAGLLAGCGGGSTRGKQLIAYYGCGACHTISGVWPQGDVGPSLVDLKATRTIAGTLPNTFANLVRWIEDAPRYAPRADMPDMGIGPDGAAAIASYLYSQ